MPRCTYSKNVYFYIHHSYNDGAVFQNFWVDTNLNLECRGFNTFKSGQEGFPMNLKISFRGSTRKHRISCRCRFLTFTCLPPCIFWHVFEKNRAARCSAIALGFIWTLLLTTYGKHLTKIIFHIYMTFDLWWLYINVDL